MLCLFGCCPRLYKDDALSHSRVQAAAEQHVRFGPHIRSHALYRGIGKGQPALALPAQHAVATRCPVQAIDAVGREIALRRGANVLMPILTPTKYREHYTLYEGAPPGRRGPIRSAACWGGLGGNL